MKICVAGWYFNPEVVKLLEQVNKNHPVQFVAHRQGDTGSLPQVVTDNIGLEFHCYSTYIRQFWDGESDVLFMHDDLEFKPLMVNFEIVAPINTFNKLAGLPVDQAYIFQDEDDAAWNAYKHGRLIFMSARLIREIKDRGGLWFDAANTGQTTTGPYNAGIVEFHSLMNQLHKQFNVCNIVYCPAIHTLRRNGGVEHSINAAV